MEEKRIKELERRIKFLENRLGNIKMRTSSNNICYSEPFFVDEDEGPFIVKRVDLLTHDSFAKITSLDELSLKRLLNRVSLLGKTMFKLNTSLEEANDILARIRKVFADAHSEGQKFIEYLEAAYQEIEEHKERILEEMQEVTKRAESFASSINNRDILLEKE